MPSAEAGMMLQRLVFPSNHLDDPSHGNDDEQGGDANINGDGDKGSHVRFTRTTIATLPLGPAVQNPNPTTDDPENNLGPYYHPDYDSSLPTLNALRRLSSITTASSTTNVGCIVQNDLSDMISSSL